MKTNTPPVESLRGLKYDKIEEMAANCAQDVINNCLEACKTKEDVDNVETFFAAFGGELCSKLVATFIYNNHFMKGKPLAVCHEMANAQASDYGVKIAETSRNHLSDIAEGKATIQKQVIKRT